jgi:signal transduction histidine kinase
MTRQIGLAILLTVSVILVACGATAYLATRAVLLADLDASLTARAMAQPVDHPTTAPAMAAPQLIRAAFVTMPDGSRVRSITLRAMTRRAGDDQPTPVTISYSGSAAHFDGLLRRLGWSLLAAGLLGAILAAAIAHAVAGASLRPLRETAEVVASIDGQGLHRRISEQNLPPELLPVARRLNEMLARLEESARQREQFIADASHELRTPVAALVTAIEVALRRPRDAQSYRATLQTGLADAHLLKRLVEALLVQARSGLTRPDPAPQTLELAGLVDECMTVVRPLADQRSIRIESSVARGILLQTQPDRLRSILLNLLGNAIEYNRDGGDVTISARVDGHDLVLEVHDSGPGIAAEHLSHLFDPLFRVDQARSSGHLGLGLYLVQTHARALGGRCTARSEPGVGSTFEVRLPGGSIPQDASASQFARA